MKNRKILAIVILLLNLGISGMAHAANVGHDNFQKLDERFQALSTEIHQYHADYHKDRLGRTGDADVLHSKVKALNETGKPLDAIAYGLLNLPAILNNINHPATIYLMTVLLDYNEFNHAKKLYDIIVVEADDFTLAKAEFLLGQYYFRRKNWSLCDYHLTRALDNGVLDEVDRHQALVLGGVLLQYNSQHREAIRYYQKVPVDSKYYPVAQINIALVNIRQGWWTDAHIIINDLLDGQTNAQGEKSPEKIEMINRLYVILGYSMLKTEFYRYAREAFRNVEIDSIHASQALLGIGLSAAGQEDYIGALSAFNRLSENSVHSIYKDESYLLLPYTYARLKQTARASEAYDAAIEYYQLRIKQLQALLLSQNGINAHLYSGSRNPQITLNKQTFDTSDIYPAVFLDNFSMLYRFKQAVDDPQLLSRLNPLYQQYGATYEDILKTAIDRHSGYLTSYQSQSRFGLANVYDQK